MKLRQALRDKLLLGSLLLVLLLIVPLASRAQGKIVYTSYPNTGPSQIYLMNADGTNQTNVSNTSSDELEPALSPDGGKIAFTSTRDGNYEIYIMNADGSNQTRLTNN